MNISGAITVVACHLLPCLMQTIHPGKAILSVVERFTGGLQDEKDALESASIASERNDQMNECLIWLISQANTDEMLTITLNSVCNVMGSLIEGIIM
jgi:hypothetical protein